MRQFNHVIVGVALMISLAGTACAADLKIFGSRVTKMVVGDVGPGFEQATGNKLTVITDVAAVMSGASSRASRSTSPCWSTSRPTS